MRWMSLRMEKRKLQHEGHEAEDELRGEELIERTPRIDPVLDPCMKSLVRVAAWLFAEQ